MAPLSNFNPKQLTALREDRKLTQAALAHKIDCPARTVNRWEKGKVTRLRRHTLDKLCKALNTTEQQLRAEGPFPQRPTLADSPRGQFNVAIGSACRNAFGLVQLRYGVTRQEIVEAAPLMFFILAEQSLRERSRRLEELQARAEALSDVRVPHLPGWGLSAMYDGATQAEEESIAAFDLFAARVREQVGWSESIDEVIDDRNPFAEFLRNSLKEVGLSAAFQYWVRGLSPSYRICTEEAADIVGGDPEATAAILSGVAAVHEMPPDVRNGSKAERSAWCRAQAERSRRRAEEYKEWSEQLDDPLDLFDDEKFERWRREHSERRTGGSKTLADPAAVERGKTHQPEGPNDGGTTP